MAHRSLRHARGVFPFVPQFCLISMDPGSSSAASTGCRVLPPGWEVRESKRYPGRFYYCNPSTGISSWEIPGQNGKQTSQAFQQTSQASRKKKRKRTRRSSSAAVALENVNLSTAQTPFDNGYGNLAGNASMSATSRSSQKRKQHSTTGCSHAELAAKQSSDVRSARSEGTCQLTPIGSQSQNASSREPQHSSATLSQTGKHLLQRPLDTPLPFTTETSPRRLRSDSAGSTRPEPLKAKRQSKTGVNSSFGGKVNSAGSAEFTLSPKEPAVSGNVSKQTSTSQSQNTRQSATVTRSQTARGNSTSADGGTKSTQTKRKSDFAQRKEKLNTAWSTDGSPSKKHRKSSVSEQQSQESQPGSAGDNSRHKRKKKRSKPSKRKGNSIQVPQVVNVKKDEPATANLGVNTQEKVLQQGTPVRSQVLHTPQGENLMSKNVSKSRRPSATQDVFSTSQGAFVETTGSLPVPQRNPVTPEGTKSQEVFSTPQGTPTLCSGANFLGANTLFTPQGPHPRGVFPTAQGKPPAQLSDSFGTNSAPPVHRISAFSHFQHQGMSIKRGTPSPVITLPTGSFTERVNTDAGVDDMEVDEDDDMMMDLHEIRGVRPEMDKVVGMLTESIHQSQRPSTPVQLSHTDAGKLVYIVLDTNVLMGALTFVQHLRDMFLKGLGRPYLIIPWVVLQELDALKGKNQNIKEKRNRQAQNAVRYLHSCFVSKHPRIRGQTPQEACEQFQHLAVQCNDDHILQCCVQCQKKYPGEKVMLLTDDMNLQNKAVVMGIDSSSTKSMMPLLTSVMENMPPESPRPNTVESNATVAPEQSTPVTGPSSTPTQNVNKQKEERAMVDDALCCTKAALEHCLKPVVEKEMEEAYGDMWTSIIFMKPPWSAYDLVCNLHKHWIAVFGITFPRSLQGVVEDLVTKLKPETATQLTLPKVLEVAEGCRQLVQIIKTNNKYSKVAGEAETQLEQLLARIKSKTPQPSTHTDQQTPIHPSQTTSAPLSKPPDFQPWSSHSPASQPPDFQPLSNNLSPAGRPPDFQPQPNHTPVIHPTPMQSSATPTSSQLGIRSNRNVARNPSDTEKTFQQNVKLAHDNRSFTPSPVEGNRSRSHTSVRLTPDYKTVIQDTFQAVWGAVFNCCNNIEGMLGRTMSSAELAEVKATLTVLVPLVQQIHDEFAKCLSFSPVGLENRTKDFVLFCSLLNGFFASTNIPHPNLPKVTAADMVAFMRETSNRVTLRNGLQQLDDFISRLHNIVNHLPT